MSCGKRAYTTPEIAEEALIEAHIQYQYPKGSGPIAIYQCEDCGRFHLTSRGEMNPTLAKYYEEGKIKLQKEAQQWMNRIKGR